jgi:ATP-dependent DNA helicase RecG
MIIYNDIYRVETYEYPKEAVREALHNAVAHKDYTGATPIQISVYKDKIMIWNYGQLPKNWTIDTLQKKHSSVPYNPDISNAFFRIGYIEAWGRGIRKMNEQCADAGLPKPLYYYESSGFWVVFRKDLINEGDLKNAGLKDRQIKAVLYVKEKGKITNKEYQEINSISRQMATNELHDLVNTFKLLINNGHGAGSYFELVK